MFIKKKEKKILTRPYGKFKNSHFNDKTIEAFPLTWEETSKK